MKVIIAGIRDFYDQELVNRELTKLNSYLGITEVFSGNANGADRCGEIWADSVKLPIRLFPADWTKYKHSAGPIRNNQMADHADALIAFWDGFSRGTGNMIQVMCERAKPVYVVGLGKNYGVVKRGYQKASEVREGAVREEKPPGRW